LVSIFPHLKVKIDISPNLRDISVYLENLVRSWIIIQFYQIAWTLASYHVHVFLEALLPQLRQSFLDLKVRRRIKNHGTTNQGNLVDNHLEL